MIPSGKIYLCANTNLKYQSEDTIVFASETDKRNYFNNKVVKSFTDQQYIRANTNGVSSTLSGTLYVAPGTSSIKVDCPIAQIYNIDYMFYIDESYANKVFYNFVTDVTYVSDNVTQITFTEDVFMTWHNNITIQNSFVERESTSVDEPYSDAHDLPDIISGEYREYARTDIQSSWTQATYGCMVLNTIAFPVLDSTAGGMVIDTGEMTNGSGTSLGYYSGYGKNQKRLDSLVYVFFKLNSLATDTAMKVAFGTYFNHNVSTHLFDKTRGKYDIIALYSVPEMCVPYSAINFLSSNPTGMAMIVPNDAYSLRGTNPAIEWLVPSAVYTYQSSATTENTGSIAYSVPYVNMGYTPKNKKLYSAPYCYYLVTNNQGQTVKFKPQHFPRSNGQFDMSFKMIGSFSNFCCIDLIPFGYELPSSPSQLNPAYKISLDSYPEVVYQYDKAADYNQAKLISNTIATVGSLSNFANGITNTIGNAQSDKSNSSGNNASDIIGSITSGVNVAGNIVNALQDYQLSTKWDFPEVQGVDKSGIVPTAEDLMKFTVISFALDVESVKAIDNLFTRYGYAVKKIKSVSIGLNNRRNFHFVKTDGCNITGNVPMYAKNFLNDRFDKGIRMWSPTYYLTDLNNNPLVN